MAENSGRIGKSPGRTENGPGLTAEERMVLALLKQALTGGPGPDDGDISWPEVIRLADRHALLPLFYDVLDQRENGPGAAERERSRDAALICARQYFRLSWWTARAQICLADAGVPTAVLKGTGVSALYPVPEYRKSGDIDLYFLKQCADEEEKKSGIRTEEEVLASQLEKSVTALASIGFQRDLSHPVSNHVVFDRTDGLRLELHTFLTEPVDDDDVNRRIWEIQRSGELKTERIESEGQSFTILSGEAQAFSLLLHMLHHFLRSGFGLKLLADWVVFWNHVPNEDGGVRERYESLVRSCGLTGFSDLVTTVCMRDLGLKGLRPSRPSGNALCEHFLHEVFASGEFGEEDEARMVMLRGTSLKDYAREFHHRMKLNFPKASAYPVLYPALWVRTLVRFLVNNRRVRNTTMSAVLRKAGERSRFMEELHLFQR